MTYDRTRDLPRVLPVWPYEMDDAAATREGHAALICRLTDALRAERKAGETNHWTYDPSRHRNLRHVHRAELALFESQWGQLEAA